MNTSTSLFAKALATENIFVSFDTTAKTALFDVETRTLVIPDWNVSNILRDMIVAHEVAHALFTPADQLLSAMQSARDRKLNPNGYKACINIIEDARIERLIKEKFPGCRRDFYAGYKEIMDTDLFELKNIKPSDLTIVDKINLHFKFGLFGLMNISMTDAESKIISRVDAAKTFDDVIAIANDLYDMAAEEEKEKKKTSMFGNSDLGESIGQKMKIDGDAEKVKNNYGNITSKDFPYLSYALPKANSSAAILSAADIIEQKEFVVSFYTKQLSQPNYSDAARSMLVDVSAKVSTTLEEYRVQSRNMVCELVSQFERRKAAEEIRKERMKPTGNINPDRLHQYKTHEDIFLRNLIKNEGKKHGMVMLIDWSGSMAECLDGVVRQTLLLAWFCRKAKIPFKVFTFTERSYMVNADGRQESNYDHLKHISALYGENYRKNLTNNSSNAICLSDVCLREVLSSEMTDDTFKQMETVLWEIAMGCRSELLNNNERDVLWNLIPPCMHLHGTPTCEALMVMHDYIPKFKDATGAQIVDFILMTDGDPVGLSRTGNYAYIPVKGLRIQNMATGRTLNLNADIASRYGKGQIHTLQTDLQFFLVDEIRRLGCVTVGFAIGSMSGIGSHYLRKFIRPHNDGVSMDMVEQMDKQYNDFYKKENFIPSDPSLTPGFDEFYMVRPVKPTNADMDESINANNSTLTKIRNSFLKSLNNSKCSRVFLSRFIDLIAGRKVKKFKIMGA